MIFFQPYIKYNFFFYFFVLYIKSEQILNIRITSVSSRKLQEFYDQNSHPYYEIGLCSFYHKKFEGRKTATGDIFSNKKYTCAHKTLPLPSIILVLFLEGSEMKGLRLLLNDRGPYKPKRILDVSYNIAEYLKIKKLGLRKIMIMFLPKDSEEILITKRYLFHKKILNMHEICYLLCKNNIDFI
jgi:rare lipoprotein A (peptidoglycan hydrolase)